MTTFWREGHYRNGFYVRGHAVTRRNWSKDTSVYHNANIYPVEQTIFSNFTIPNASCPLCGDSVFYYENSSGSKVWFDELGPPWLIHDCFELDASTKITSCMSENNEGISVNSSDVLNLNSEELILESGKPIDTDCSFSKIPCLIQRCIAKNGKIYVTAKIYNQQKKERFILLIFKEIEVSFDNCICFVSLVDMHRVDLSFFDINKMQYGTFKGIEIQSPDIFKFLLKHDLKNDEYIVDIKSYKRKIKALQHHMKVSLAHWLYSNTMLSVEDLSIFSGLNEFEINQLINDRLSSTHTPQSPVTIGLISKEAFDLLINNTEEVSELL
jgi:hypothetical protein